MAFLFLAGGAGVFPGVIAEADPGVGGLPYGTFLLLPGFPSFPGVFPGVIALSVIVLDLEVAKINYNIVNR